MKCFDIITIFPDFFESFKKEGLITRALNKKLISIKAHNLRNFAGDKRGTVDDRPYGGGAGMVLKIEPIYKTVRSITLQQDQGRREQNRSRTILLSAKGKTFTQKDARRLAKYDQLIFICGRYEGVDERVAKYIADEEISIGNYVLFGGEVPAMVVIEAVSRLIPGVVAKKESTKNESFSHWKLENGKWKFNKEHPQYTRPEMFGLGSKKLRVPKVLLSGDHKKINEWRKKNLK